MDTLLIASANVGKLREIQQILQDLSIAMVLPKQIGLSLEVEEDGRTYAENAAKKALAYYQASGMVTLADDSGLEVEALDGQPGLYSARYAPWPDATDADRRRYLLQQLAGKPRPWKARFHATVAVADSHGELHLVEGNCPGEVIPEERGTGGFGYDPIFFMPELGKTMAELPEAVKNQVSHRGRAVRAAAPILAKLLSAS
jgi:XTP/dITP diphosphohydrolase